MRYTLFLFILSLTAYRQKASYRVVIYSSNRARSCFAAFNLQVVFVLYNVKQTHTKIPRRFLRNRLHAVIPLVKFRQFNHWLGCLICVASSKAELSKPFMRFVWIPPTFQRLYNSLVLRCFVRRLSVEIALYRR